MKTLEDTKDGETTNLFWTQKALLRAKAAQ